MLKNNSTGSNSETIFQQGVERAITHLRTVAPERLRYEVLSSDWQYVFPNNDAARELERDISKGTGIHPDSPVFSRVQKDILHRLGSELGYVREQTPSDGFMTGKPDIFDRPIPPNLILTFAKQAFG